MLAAELEVDFTAVATIGLGGHIFDKAKVANPDGVTGSPEQIIDVLAGLAAPLLASLPPSHRLVGVGTAAAGLVRREDGFLSDSPNRGWKNAAARRDDRPSRSASAASGSPTKPMSARSPNIRRAPRDTLAT